MMGQNLKWRFFVIVGVFLFAVITILPNFVKLDEESWIFSTQKINYGLDIQGGLHMVMGVDIEDVIETQAQRLGSTLQEELKDVEVNVSEYNVTKEGSQIWLNLIFGSVNDIKGASDFLEKEYGTTLQIINTVGNKLTVRYLNTYLKQLREDTLNQAIETIRNRIDEFGVSEPSITAQGGERILIQLPGLKEAEKAKALINKTAQLQFMMVSSEEIDVSNWIREAEEAGGYNAGSLKYSEYVKRINNDLKDKLPKETTLRFGKAENVEDIQLAKVPYLLETSTNLGGESLKDAFVSMGEFNEPVVTVYFNPQGGKKFADLTAENVGRSMAIVLDDVVYSAPRINERIPGGQATITMGGGRDYEAIMEESRMISMALRAGALPAKLEQLEERTVGPSLGADSIEKGKQAGIVGAILVLAFMLFWYKSFGLIANLALLFNVGLVLAILTSLEATLTLPGIAGIALTIGMAVDANVIVFERIKEELRRGTSLAGSIREGYAKAFSAIFDANLTTAATSIILMYYGTGPVRGFAVTLLIGIITSMFTALFVTHTVLDLIVGKFKKINLALK